MDTFKDTRETLATVKDFIRWGASRFNEASLFFGHGTDNAADEAAWLVLHALHLPPDMPDSFFECRLTDAEKRAVYELLVQRIETRKPAAYLTGEIWFKGLRFVVDDRVLVPRSSLAELIENHFTPWIKPGNVHRVLDLCTGSACIAVACALEFPESRVDAADISSDALAVAEQNVARYGLQDDVRLMRSDLFGALSDDDQYNIIISNPPYVSDAEIETLPEEYNHEPRLGLDGGGDDGLDLVARLLHDAPAHLQAGGILVVEVGDSWPALQARYPAVDFTWLDYERGEQGAFLLTKEQLEEHQKKFT
ncbi:MAG TPA: 50S ribosomal protein L3 N(5)-glutamine methyltransferase [Gammaproteobacteria bacterium]|nr:50S ribosomal protein L3 N(5)-glutamine methyltransferase [Gammaproteobacteria bacterium]